jgi:hypothetical protein
MDQMEWEKLQMMLQQGQQQVPQGNPMADHFSGRAVEYFGSSLGHRAAIAPWMMAGTAAGAMGNLPASAASIIPMLYHEYQAQQARQRQGEMGQGADMWFNRFGTGDPNQGLPGSPSGPAYRRR